MWRSRARLRVPRWVGAARAALSGTHPRRPKSAARASVAVGLGRRGTRARGQQSGRAQTRCATGQRASRRRGRTCRRGAGADAAALGSAAGWRARGGPPQNLPRRPPRGVSRMSYDAIYRQTSLGDRALPPSRRVAPRAASTRGVNVITPRAQPNGRSSSTLGWPRRSAPAAAAGRGSSGGCRGAAARTPRRWAPSAAHLPAWPPDARTPQCSTPPVGSEAGAPGAPAAAADTAAEGQMRPGTPAAPATRAAGCADRRARPAPATAPRAWRTLGRHSGAAVLLVRCARKAHDTLRVWLHGGACACSLRTRTGGRGCAAAPLCRCAAAPR